MKKSLFALCASALLLASCAGTATAPTSGSGVVSGSGATSSTETLKTFTMAEVETHQTVEDCYGVIDGVVYDLTDWINRHPAGPEPIISICGTDTGDFQHPGTSFQAMKGRIKRYQVGTLAE